MKSLFFCLLTLSLVTFCFADEDPYAQPDWGYAYYDPHYVPSSSPDELKAFHNEMIPMMEAEGHAESAYIREYSHDLYLAAKEVPGSLESDSGYQKKYFNKAARDLVKNCKELYVMSYGAPSGELYSIMREIESDYLRLANLSDN